MKKIGELSGFGYGMSVLSTELFTQYLKDKNCKARKLLTYFGRNEELFYESISDGKFLPISIISSFEYSIFIAIDEQNIVLPEDYKPVFSYNDFYLEVGKCNKICLASFDYLEYSLKNIKLNITDKEVTIPTGPDSILEKYNLAKSFEIEEGIYEFDLIGLERKTKLKRQSKNYAYAFIFRKNEFATNNNIEKADNSKYKFDLA